MKKKDKFKFHILCSAMELFCSFGILALQITLTITKTCTFRIGIGYWSFPFLILSPISIWIFLWKRNLIFYYITFIIHICSNLFITTVFLINLLVLIQHIDFICPISDNSSLSLNISLIVLSIILKLFFYVEIFLLNLFRRYKH